MTSFFIGLVCFVLGSVVGFAVGFLVYRNNQKAINQAESDAKDVVKEIKTDVKEVKEGVQKVVKDLTPKK